MRINGHQKGVFHHLSVLITPPKKCTGMFRNMYLKEHCKAEFQPEDRETMVKLNTNFATTRYRVFGSCFIGALFTVLGLTLCIHSCGEQNVMERKLKEQTEIANFGTFIKNRFPKAYNAWVDETKAGQKSGKSGSNTNGETTKSRDEDGQEHN